MHEPQPIIFLLNIAGAAALLIWAVRLVRTGVERGFSTPLRKWLRHSAKNRVLAAGSGMSAAILLQSSTAVAVLVSNFVARGNLTAAVGLAILLGADVGSAVVSQLLLLRQAFLIPMLLVIGVALFLRGTSGPIRQVGRILIGLALIFLSLDMISDATGPMIESPGTEAVMRYLGRDLFTAFMIGAIFAWIVHSSVAAVLFFVTLAGQSLLPIGGAVAMMLGANLGGAFIAYVLTASAPPEARKMVVANLILRGGGAALVLLLLPMIPDFIASLGSGPARQAINLHLVFNFALALVALPFAEPITALVSKFLSDGSSTASPEEASALDPAALDPPSRGLDCSARELLRMGHKIEHMLRAIGPLYDTWDEATAKNIKQEDKAVKQMHFEIKLYLARLGRSGLDEDLSGRSMELASISTSLETASDAIGRNMLELARRLNDRSASFSEQGRQDIVDFSDRVLSNVQLALNVMLNQNPGEARELVGAKEKVRSIEQKLQRSHLGRLRAGLVDSIETSNVHQETLRALKQVNTSFSMVGYPILAKSGDLLKSRLADG